MYFDKYTVLVAPSTMSYQNYLPILFILLSSGFPQWVSGIVCPCSSPHLCSIVTKQFDKELVVFDSADSDRWSNYTWNEVSNVILFGSLQNYSNLYCFAHKHNIRVTALVGVPVDLFPKLNSVDFRRSVINEWISLVQNYHLDGINIDIEGNAFTDDVVQGITDITREAYVALKALNSSYLVTWDVPYSPFLAGCISGYCYDYVSISKYCDYLIVMDYDATLDILFASANSPINLISKGYSQYIKELNIAHDKLVMAVPWYGYNYSCSHFLNYTGDDICIIANAAQSQILLKDILNLYSKNIGGLKWSDESQSPYFVMYQNGVYHEIWFDNLRSLEIKFKLAESLDLKGLGMWRADALDYTSQVDSIKKYNDALWSSINSYIEQMKK